MVLAVVATLLLLIVYGMPIAFAIGLSALGYMWLSDVPLIIFAQRVATGPDSWVLLAMPSFVLAGLLMNDTGISDRLIKFAETAFGYLRGGLAMVNVAASMLFGGISGSSVADTAALGSVLIPSMSRRGYSPEVSAAITSSSASIGIVIPPSIPMILFGAVSSVSVGTLFIAGILPGILIGLTQMLLIALLARRHGWGAVQTFSLRRLARTAFEALPALIMPIIIIGGILTGVFTPTEAGGVAVLYGLLAALIFYRPVQWRAIYRALVNAGVLTAVVMIIISMSYALGWVMAHEEIPQQIAAWAGQLALGPTGLLLLVSAILIVLGAILHGDPLLLIMTPILLPAVVAAGIDPLQFGIVMVLCIAIGQQTPPVGSTLFVVSAIAGRDIFAVSRANIPFVMTLVFVLLVVIFLPQIVFFLPRLAGLH
ncbi:TRAP transporter large permease [Rhodoligotrophos defluvii]|uniref:TRAP transporter large permease n=1 Tax=Rhodoligotrophos defluvii TaxID=2561934 RepID=UPI001EF06772|nr:TRAP transporter large permease [Rhodoligotrophos defluvii]